MTLSKGASISCLFAIRVAMDTHVSYMIFFSAISVARLSASFIASVVEQTSSSASDGGVLRGVTNESSTTKHYIIDDRNKYGAVG